MLTQVNPENQEIKPSKLERAAQYMGLLETALNIGTGVSKFLPKTAGTTPSGGVTDPRRFMSTWT